MTVAEASVRSERVDIEGFGVGWQGDCDLCGWHTRASTDRKWVFEVIDLHRSRCPGLPELTDNERRLIEAIRLTVEYVGLDTLRPIAGWSWFDAWCAVDPSGLDEWLWSMEHPALPPTDDVAVANV